MNDLKSVPVWVCWKRDPKRGKIPINALTGGNAQSDNPATWTTYEKATAAAESYDGVGFMFSDGVCGIDIDDYQDDPEREQRAKDILAHMYTYTEYSPSGNGYHLIFRADINRLPAEYKALYYQKNVQTGVECYLSGMTNRYFTFTGEAVNDLDVEDRTEQLLTFLDKYMKKENPPQRRNATEDGTDGIPTNATKVNILSIARKAKNGNKFITLFDHGDISQYNGDDSSADIALCNILAFYCQGDATMIDSLFRQSALYREKWERQDYRERTINDAVARCGGKFYKPRKNRTRQDRTPVKIEKFPGAIYINPFDTPEARQRYRQTDVGAGNLFADTYKNIARYVPEAKAWYVYDGRVWRMDLGSVAVVQMAKHLTDYMLDYRQLIEDEETIEKWVGYVYNRMKRAARDTMLKDAEAVYPVSILEFDKDPYILNCKNCTLNLKDFTRHEHRPTDFLSKLANVTFDPAAKCERWTSFISEIMCGDMDTARFLQKSLGYSLTGDTSMECFFILYGSTTRNGKGTTMETTLHILGDYGRTAQPETIAQKQNANSGAPSEDIARLKGARFVNMSEPDKGLRLNSALVKQMTGGDSITARFLHQNSFEFRPEYKLFISTNHLPRVTDDSIFASGRVRLIPFERHFLENERDEGLKAQFKQPENMAGIFNWIIEGLKLMRTEGLKQPQAVKDATAQYREDSDTVGLFVRECLVETKHKTLIKDVYAEYENWCDENGYRALSKNNLTTELRRRGLKIERSDKSKTFLFDYGIVVQDDDDDLPAEWRTPISVRK